LGIDVAAKRQILTNRIKLEQMVGDWHANFGIGQTVLVQPRNALALSRAPIFHFQFVFQMAACQDSGWLVKV
jgi:hypothetical protein